MEDRAKKVDLAHLLSAQVRELYSSSTMFMCLYDTAKDVVLDVNSAATMHMGVNATWDVDVTCSMETEIYLKMDGIPCKLMLLSQIRDDVKLMNICAAHTKKWNQASDLVSLTDVTSDGVWEWFPELNFEYMSERFWNILGYSQKDMEECPSSWMEFLNPDDKVKVLCMYEDHVKTKGLSPYMINARYTKSDGSEVIVLCRGTVVDWLPDGRPWRMLGVHTDITNIVKKDSIEARSKFISRMSHEIRSPICTILNECELLGDTVKTSVISDTCKHLISLTDDILSIDAASSADHHMSVACENLSAVISKCFKRHRLEAKKKGLKIRSMVDDLPETVMMDVCKFNQVLDNLIGNSIKYSESGTIVVDVEYEEDSCTCSIRVTDKGVGMDPSFHTSAFEELVQGDSTMLGAGIGLALCRKLARYMEGDVTIERSSLGEGTTMLFVCHLPVCEQTQTDTDSTSNDDTGGEGRCVRILLVDDISTNRQILRRKLYTLKSFGLNVGEIVDAVDGVDAVSKFTEYKGNFQLVLMDCHMPILDGFSATEKIHSLCFELSLEAVPVVAVTASVSEGIHEKCRLAGMKYVVTKPYSEIDLLTSIQSCCNSAQKKI